MRDNAQESYIADSDPLLTVKNSLHHSPAGFGQIAFDFYIAGLTSSTICTVKASILIPDSFSGTSVGLALLGYASEDPVVADINRRNVWQDVSVTARIPADATTAAVTLMVDCVGEASGPLYSSGWRLDISPCRKSFKVIKAADLARTSPQARVVEQHPDLTLPVAPIVFGQIEQPTFPMVQYPVGPWNGAEIHWRSPTSYEFDDAVIHGSDGIVTVGEYLLEETYLLADLDAVKGRWADDYRSFTFDCLESKIDIAEGAFFFSGYPTGRNYAHWIIDLLTTITEEDINSRAPLIFPSIRSSWQRQALDLAGDVRNPIFVDDGVAVRCRKLRIDHTKLIDAGNHPHPMRLDRIARMRDASGFDPSKQRLIYISRSDTGARRLLNESEVENALAERGFEILTLSRMTVAEQVRAFGEARIVVGPHGAGLVNVAYCRPDSVFIELHVDNYMQWSMRRLASIVPLRYGCVVGREVGFVAIQQHKVWTIAVDDVVCAVDIAMNEAFRAQFVA